MELTRRHLVCVLSAHVSIQVKGAGVTTFLVDFSLFVPVSFTLMGFRWIMAVTTLGILVSTSTSEDLPTTKHQPATGINQRKDIVNRTCQYCQQAGN